MNKWYEEIKASPKNINPNANTIIANGKVSSSGALEEISPSLFRPRLRFKNEPAESPNKQLNPRKEPNMNALDSDDPVSHQLPS